MSDAEKNSAGAATPEPSLGSQCFEQNNNSKKDVKNEQKHIERRNNRPSIVVEDGHLIEMVDQAEEALICSDQNLYQRGDVIVYPAQKVIAVSGGKEIKVQRLVQMTKHHLKECMMRAAIWGKYNVKGGYELCDCPMKVAETYLAREGKWELPRLTGVINCPTIRADGSILDIPGYDRATGILYDPQGVKFPPIPKNPTKGDAELALGVLKSLIETFPFVSEADRSVALSAILTAVIRRSIDTAPLHGFTAPTAGSGKSKLVDIASMIVAGRQAAVISQGRTEEELEKRLGAALIAGDPIVTLDNCENPLGGELLCQTLTQTVIKIRILGKSVLVEVPSNAAIFATGNNLTVVGDMTRRILLCSLDPGVERPELREYEFDPVNIEVAPENWTGGLSGVLISPPRGRSTTYDQENPAESQQRVQGEGCA